MSVIDRTTAYYFGRAIVVFDGVTLYPGPQPLLVKTTTEYFPINVAGAGTVDKKIKQIMTEVTLVPHGAVSAAILALLCPHGSPVEGASAMPAIEKTLVIHPANGKEKLTFASAFVSRMPDLSFSTVKTLFGQVTITCIGKNAEAWSVADHFVKVEDAAFSDTGLGGATLTIPYTASLGALSAPWNEIWTKSGWTVVANIGIKPREEDSIGIYDFVYTGEHSLTIRCNPIGIKVADLHALKLLQGSGAARGASGVTLNQDLTITGGSGNPIFVGKNMVLDTAQHQYGSDDRVEDLEFTSFRGITNGALDAVFTIGLVA